MHFSHRAKRLGITGRVERAQLNLQLAGDLLSILVIVLKEAKTDHKQGYGPVPNRWPSGGQWDFGAVDKTQAVSSLLAPARHLEVVMTGTTVGMRYGQLGPHRFDTLFSGEIRQG